MSIKINGPILRNINGEPEGISTPSLVLDGVPLGNSKLYKHIVDVYFKLWSNSKTCHKTKCIFYLTSSEPLTVESIENDAIVGKFCIEPVNWLFRDRDLKWTTIQAVTKNKIIITATKMNICNSERNVFYYDRFENDIITEI